jgi:hypothetical protein
MLAHVHQDLACEPADELPRLGIWIGVEAVVDDEIESFVVLHLLKVRPQRGADSPTFQLGRTQFEQQAAETLRRELDGFLGVLERLDHGWVADPPPDSPEP